MATLIVHMLLHHTDTAIDATKVQRLLVIHEAPYILAILHSTAYSSSEPLSGANAALANSSFSRRTSASIAASRSKPSFTC